MIFKKSTIWAAGAALILCGLWLSLGAARANLLGPGFVLEKDDPWEINIDVGHGLNFDSSYQFSGKIVPEYHIGDFGIGLMGNLRDFNPYWQVGPGLRENWMFYKWLTDTGLRLEADETWWPDQQKASLEGGLVVDLSGLCRLGVKENYDTKSNDSILMLYAGFDVLPWTRLNPQPPDPVFNVSKTAPMTFLNPDSRAPRSGKTALVISGGGSTGAWAVGALEVLRQYFTDNNIHIDMVCGTSTGSLIATLMASGEPATLTNNMATLEQIYTTTTSKDIYTVYSPSNMVHAGGVINTKPLQQTIRKYIGDRADYVITQKDVELIIATADVQTDQTVNFYTGPDELGTDDPMKAFANDHWGTQGRQPWSDVRDRRLAVSRIQDPDTLMRVMLASSSDPVLFPLTHIPTGPSGTDQYVDGGVLDFTPLEIALANGADTIYAIILSPSFPDRSTDQFNDLFGILGRTSNWMFPNRVDIADTQEAENYIDAWNAFYKNDPAKMKHLYQIRPLHTIPGNSNVFDPATMTQWMEDGRQRARFMIKEWQQAGYEIRAWDQRDKPAEKPKPEKGK